MSQIKSPIHYQPLIKLKLVYFESQTKLLILEHLPSLEHPYHHQTN